jgi:hypothetical protein
MGEWIDVRERLPEIDAYVIVAAAENLVAEGWMRAPGKWRWTRFPSADMVQTVIAWQPHSLPPEAKEGA